MHRLERTGAKYGIVLCAWSALLVWAGVAGGAYPTGPQITDKLTPGQITVGLVDYATAPNTAQSPTDRTAAQVARINFMRSDPVDPSKYVVNDLNGNLYLLDKSTRQFSTFFSFPSIFPNFDINPGFAAG